MQQINREPQDTLPHRLQPLLAPRSVALVGASRKRNSVGNDMMRNLIPSGYPGAIYPVNPSYDQLYGHACYPSLSALPEAVDLAVLSVPNRVLERVVDESISVGVKALVIFASAELEGETDSLLRDRIAAKARAAGIPVCGANCMGFFNPEHPLRAFSAFHPDPIELGGLTYIAQSGSLLQALLFNDERLKFNLAVSTGQELVTSAADFMDYALDQPSTRVIALVLETIRDPQAFIAALEKARARAVPVIVLKLGRTEAGAHFALSHTGAIAGNAEVYEALFRRHGVISVRDLNELAATAILLGTARRAAPGGLAAILDSGGERELIVDCASDLGVPFASISAETTEVLQKTLDSGLTPVNPVDAWGTGKDFEMVFETCLTALMQDADTAIGMFVADLSEELDLHAGYVDVCQAVARATDKPLVVMTNYSAWSHRKHAVRLARSGVAVLDGTAASLRAVRHALEYRDFLARPAAKAPLAENPRAAHWRSVLARRQDVQWLATGIGQHHGLGGLFQEIELLERLCHGFGTDRDAVVAHHQAGVVAQCCGEPFTFLGLIRDPAEACVNGKVAVEARRVVVQRLQGRILQGRKSRGIGRMGMDQHPHLWAAAVDRAMHCPCRGVRSVGAVHHVRVVGVQQKQVAGPD